MAYFQFPSSYSPNGVLELCLKDILSFVKPSENDHLMRLRTINELTTLIRSVESLKDVVVRPFGSFVSNLYTKWGDLDTSVELSRSSPSFTGKKRKQNALRDIMRVLRRNGVASKFNFIPSARVPLLKFESNRDNVSCDVSIDNHVGWMKSRILLLISEIDDRFRDMVLLTKEWAKTHHINDPKSGTLNSYSLCLLVIFHFQTCKPAILPPLKDIFEGNLFDITGTWSSLERQIEDGCAANIAMFKRCRQRNESTVCQLLVSFFEKFSKIERTSSEYAICTYTAQWEGRESNPRWMEKSHTLLIEDPFERPENAARAVGPRELIIISEAFATTYQQLSSYSVLSSRNALLDNLVRPNISSCLKVGTRVDYTSKRNRSNPQAGNVVHHSPRSANVVSHVNYAPTNGRFQGVGKSNPQAGNVVHHSLRPANVVSHVNYAPTDGRFQGVGKINAYQASPSPGTAHVYQASPSTVGRQRQQYTSVHAQQVWRPREHNP